MAVICHSIGKFIHTAHQHGFRAFFLQPAAGIHQCQWQRHVKLINGKIGTARIEKNGNMRGSSIVNRTGKTGGRAYCIVSGNNIFKIRMVACGTHSCGNNNAHGVQIGFSMPGGICIFQCQKTAHQCHTGVMVISAQGFVRNEIREQGCIGQQGRNFNVTFWQMHGCALGQNLPFFHGRLQCGMTAAKSGCHADACNRNLHFRSPAPISSTALFPPKARVSDRAMLP